MSADLSGYIADIARRILGEPNRTYSTRKELRFGSRGSISVMIAGPKRGEWYDHENNVGGGPREFIQLKGAVPEDEIVDWLAREGIKPNGEDRSRQIVATYDYRDEQGALLFQVVRFAPKDFRQRHPNGIGGWIWSTAGVRKVLYRLPELLAAPIDELVFIAEGEKDANRLAGLNLIATTNPGGAAKAGAKSKWRPEYNKFLRGRRVCALPDNDDAGRDHAKSIAANLAPIARSSAIIELPGLAPKGDVSDWLDAGHTREELIALADRAEPVVPAPANKGNGRDHDTAAGQPVAVIRVVKGERHKAADDGIAAMERARTPFYQRDGKLVRVCRIKAKTSDGETILLPGIASVTPAILDRELGRAALWERFDARSKDWLRIDPPRDVGAQIIDMIDEWPFPPLRGIISCPTLRRDGSLLDKEGYDDKTGLVLHSNIKVPPIPEVPSRADAEDAIGLLVELLQEFPFADQASQSVGLSGCLTPVLRGAMEVAPLQLNTSPQPGTGKSYLTDVCSAISTGERAAAIAAGTKQEEMEKRLIGHALSGFPIFSIDNVHELLQGDVLAQITERPLLELRALGASPMHRIDNTFTVFANGNNAGVADDQVRRTIRCSLNANVEDPEKRVFKGNPFNTVMRNRGRYIAACLTVGRAYIAAGKPGLLPPLASYEDWSAIVRSVLVWLGFADPVDTMEAARKADPVRQDRARLFDAWVTDLRTDIFYTASEIVEKAEDALLRPALNAFLLATCYKRGMSARIDPIRVGLLLTRNEDTIANGCTLAVDRSDLRRIRYRIRPL